MDDSAFGTRDSRGDWAPLGLIDYGPLFAWPPKPLRDVRWLAGFPGYILPWNLLYAALSVAVWLLATPSVTTMKHFAFGWIALIAVRNLVLLVVWNSIFHIRLYVRHAQDNRFKYNSRFPVNKKKNAFFTFGNQTRDNVLWSLASGVPIWTAFEVTTWWMFANGHTPWLGFSRNPAWFVALMLLVPLLRELHFHLIHRMLHWPPLYKVAHSLHHRNVNPTGWSGLSMHPLEHLFYFTGVLLHWVLLSHPIHAMFHLFHAALSPIPGHTGFDRFELGDQAPVSSGGYAHYLHHKYFEVNYSDGSIPLDKWFGSFHDGSPEADEAMHTRLAAKAARRSRVG
jgi:sterol desaturase/sphingolipid hydroxylase (fatty acid hydroxylase superfamily)